MNYIKKNHYWKSHNIRKSCQLFQKIRAFCLQYLHLVLGPLFLMLNSRDFRSLEATNRSIWVSSSLVSTLFHKELLTQNNSVCCDKSLEFKFRIFFLWYTLWSGNIWIGQKNVKLYANSFDLFQNMTHLRQHTCATALPSSPYRPPIGWHSVLLSHSL